ncbi:MAG: sigma-E processing peptidase SpoIIGA [Clostridia bacterium]|nr:sigma-E processing peptidase SpoIIGA [Clostridia bacterium]
MQSVVYADILIFLNSVVTFIIILTTADLVKVDSSKIRYVSGSLVGGIFSLVILAPQMNPVLIFLTRAVICILIVLISFNVRNFKMSLKCIFAFLLISFLYAGILYFLSVNTKSHYIYYNNGYAYFDFGVLTVITISAIVFIVVRMLNSKVFSKQKEELVFDVKIEYNAHVITVKAFFDTGNSVVDFFTGKPVIIIGFNEIKEFFDSAALNSIRAILSEETNFNLPEKMRLLPVSTLGSAKILPVFTADKATIFNSDTTKIIEKPSVGISPDSFDNKKYKALINDSVLGRVI